jgi:hypothetical protein
MNRAWLDDELLEVEVVMLCWRCLDAVWGDGTALCARFERNLMLGGWRSGPVSSEEPPPLLHLAFDLVFLFRRLFRAGFCGVLSPVRA